ncbi:restriction endonuclease subunit S [Avibacterium avium]|uniref:restriction endonuclease subunit S n=1 Tax=Avibacterium avium TaxID=751 RepID=UPI003BF899EB
MNYLEKLLQGAPVEWKTLGEVCDFQNGFAFKSSLFKETGLPIIRITNVNGKTVDLSDLKYFDPNDYQKGNPLNYSIHKGDILVAMSGATTGKLGYYNHEKPAYLNQRVGKFIPNSSKLNNKYLYHFLLSKTEFLYTLAGGGAQPNLSSTDIKEKIKIPIPPLPVQKEIARILDAFTAITSELTSELTLRQKQYQHYRDKLLTFGDEVEWKTLGEVAKKISSGGTPKTDRAEYYGGSIPWLRTQEVNFGEIWDTGVKITEEGLKNSSAKLIPKNCVIIAMYGATVGRVGINKIPLTTNQACANIELDNTILNYRYLFHYLSNRYEYIKSLGAGSQTNINAKIVKNLQIPIPPIEEQKRIAGILDKFHTLAHSLSEGLPKEIALRQKQYAYYRDLLLGFEK